MTSFTGDDFNVLIIQLHYRSEEVAEDLFLVRHREFLGGSYLGCVRLLVFRLRSGCSVTILGTYVLSQLVCGKI